MAPLPIASVSAAGVATPAVCPVGDSLEIDLGPFHLALPAAPLASLALPGGPRLTDALALFNVPVRRKSSASGSGVSNAVGTVSTSGRGAALLNAGLNAISAAGDVGLKARLLGIVEFGDVLGAAGNLLSPRVRAHS